MEILHYIVVPGLDAGIFYAAGSPFMGKLSQQIASPMDIEEIILGRHPPKLGKASAKGLR